MCDSCQCNRNEPFQIHTGHPAAERDVSHSHSHSHGHGHHDHDHEHSHPHEGDGHHHPHEHEEGHSHVVPLHQSLLAHNDRHAERNRGYFDAKGVVAINLISSPGSGKTTLLARTLEVLANEMAMAVIVGDLATENDAARMRGKGAEIVQITTGTLCHLDAVMVERAARALDLAHTNLLFIENVGNLVCPSSFDLGENLRVVLLSVTEGEDKPLKYPPVFQSADLILITKSDLAEATGFDRETAFRNLKTIAPRAEIVELSARTGAGLEPWLDFLRAQFRPTEIAAEH
jgi:hydrogenase nickel incorporation protein HypB